MFHKSSDQTRKQPPMKYYDGKVLFNVMLCLNFFHLFRSLFTFIDRLPQQIQVPLSIPFQDMEDVFKEGILDCKLVCRYENLIRTKCE